MYDDLDLQPWDPIMIEWADSASYPAGWTPKEHIVASPTPARSVGMLFSRNDYGLVIVLNHDLDTDEVNGATVIPWVAVRRLVKLGAI